jgi:hypothetical protein
MEALAFPPLGGAGAGAGNYFLIYSVAFLFCHIFELSCPSFLVLSALPVFFLFYM